jgi:hypothetical protein
MATTYKIRYKNHATPQEQHSAGDRWYLDSDVGKKLTGNGSLAPAAIGTFTNNVAITTSPTQVGTNKDFVFIKNKGDNDLLITLDNSNYLIVISKGEAFASEVNTSADVRVKASSGSTIVEYYTAT